MIAFSALLADYQVYNPKNKIDYFSIEWFAAFRRHSIATLAEEFEPVNMEKHDFENRFVSYKNVLAF